MRELLPPGEEHRLSFLNEREPNYPVGLASLDASAGASASDSSEDDQHV
ncbi:hypothetical protein K2Z83_25845 [Oscillochloris sp. ZM17-4]|nr:hypothetical protein [Oscillochloris sp. ZM17-4]MBX0331079.1 hypothetical protein [Oscillochloris sp. ZM17-4]